MEHQHGVPVTVFDPVNAPTTFEGVVERLGNAIRMGLLPPGSRLPPERELAPMLQVSRWTLRKAITTLVQSGHLETARGRSGGTFVARGVEIAAAGGRLPQDWCEILDMRMAIEVGAVVLAAERAESADLFALQALVDEMSASTRFEDYRRADVRFHIGIAEAAKVPRLVTAMTDVQVQASGVFVLVPHPREVLQHANREHRLLVEAFRRHDADGAVRVIRRHLHGTEQIVAGLRSS